MMLVALLIASATQVAIVARDAEGCGTVQIGGRARAELAKGLCVRDAFAAQLEGEEIENIVLVVRDRGLFVYRVEEHKITPRFLGSGFKTLEILGARFKKPTLFVEARHRETGAAKTLACGFDEFLLTCREAS